MLILSVDIVYIIFFLSSIQFNNLLDFALMQEQVSLWTIKNISLFYLLSDSLKNHVTFLCNSRVLEIKNKINPTSPIDAAMTINVNALIDVSIDLLRMNNIL